MRSHAHLPWEKRPALWTGCFVGLGLALRAFHYGRNPSMWHDEAAAGLERHRQEFYPASRSSLLCRRRPASLSLDLNGRSSSCWATAHMPLRLVPLLASCLALVLMAFVARRLRTPEAVPWAILPFACADTIPWHACEAKPYSVDLPPSATVLLALYCWSSSWRLGWQLVLYTNDGAGHHLFDIPGLLSAGRFAGSQCCRQCGSNGVRWAFGSAMDC